MNYPYNNISNDDYNNKYNNDLNIFGTIIIII